MKVIEYIKENGLDALAEDLNIKVKVYEDYDIAVLNYCQIDSPKTHPIVMECRGLIIDMLSWEVLCRPFDRFFNAGEAPETVKDFDITRAIAYEKIDGSLIKIWHHPTMGWQCGTRGTAFAESSVNGFNVTFADLVHKALGCEDHSSFQKLCNSNLNTNVSYMFEITSMENRVVTRYEGYKLWFLGARFTESGEDIQNQIPEQLDEWADQLNVHLPKQFTFNTLEHALEASKGLKNLDEGYVLFDKVSHKRIKVKSPAYVAVHHIRGEGLNPKRIAELVCINEEDEYLTYFPEDQRFFTPYREKLDNLLHSAEELYTNSRDLEDQKEFALAVKDHPLSSSIFMARNKGCSIQECFNQQPLNFKVKILRQEVGE